MESAVVLCSECSLLYVRMGEFERAHENGSPNKIATLSGSV